MDLSLSNTVDGVVSLFKRASSEKDEPVAGTISSLVLVICSTTLLGSLLTQRWQRVKNWSNLPLVSWVVFGIFIDSWLFVFITAILKFGVGLASSYGICQGAILLCLICYLTTKVLLYLFLVEKAHIIRSGNHAKSRLKSKLYCFNSFGMLGLYIAVAALNFVFRITYLDDGNCIIGMERVAMAPLLAFDVAVNTYLTILFLLPLRQLYTFKNVQRTAANERLRTVAFRTFIGAVTTTISSVANMTVLMALNGESGWVCLLCCNLDIAFSTIMVHWVTSKDKGSASGGDSSNEYARSYGKGGGPGMVSMVGDTESRIGTRTKDGCQHECKHGCGVINGTAILSPNMQSDGFSSLSSGDYGSHGKGHRGSKMKKAGVMFSHPASPTLNQGQGGDFRKYGNMFAAMDPLHDSDGDSPGGSSHDAEYELVLRQKKEGEAAMGGAGAPWNVGKETTVVVESTVLQDEEKKGARSFGTRTVISGPNSGKPPADNEPGVGPMGNIGGLGPLGGVGGVGGAAGGSGAIGRPITGNNNNTSNTKASGSRAVTDRQDWYAHRNQDSFDHGGNNGRLSSLSSKGSTAELTSNKSPAITEFPK